MNSKKEKLIVEVKSAINVCREFGYTPNYLIRKMKSLGDFEAIEELISDKNPSKGFLWLCELRRKDLTLESIVYNNPNYHSLFSREIIENIRQKLGIRN